ncbi:MAG: response regulator [Pirellulaceae bacterium]|nr:response regulator [Pirellulaceae bacterium]
MPMLLVADDSELDRMVIVELLKKEPIDWLVEQVASAEEAVKLMKEIAFDVVITDVLMEGMSGLELLNHVHKQPRKVPVIVVSGQDTRDAAIAALQSGAANYIPKSGLPALLGETVRQVLDAASAEKNYQRLIATADDMRFHFKLNNDLGLIRPLFGLIQEMAIGMGVLTLEDCTRLGIAIDEAIVNAICHGNLELSQDDMSNVRRHLHAKCPIEIVEQRRKQAPYNSRFVYVACLITHEGVKVSVRDDGSGFALSSVDQERQGRGVTLIQNLVDKATFNEMGNEITLLKRAVAPEHPPLNKAS